MKQTLTALSQRYVMALEKNLKRGPEATLKPALALGRQAVALGLETPDLIRIHKQALATLKLSNIKNKLTSLASIFFTEANIPIEEAHCAAQQSHIHLSHMKERLGQCRKKMSIDKYPLQSSRIQQQGIGGTFEKEEERQNPCLKKSLEQQKHLRQLTHGVLAAHEDECKQISCELQDEIAQTLLGINVRLLCLKQQNRSHNNALKNEIASAQSLVAKSAEAIIQFARVLTKQS